jgi:hypothetical protein
MSQVFAQEVFVALAPVLLLVIRRLAYLPEGASRTLEVAEPEYKDLYQLVEDTYESVKSRLETGSSEKLTLRSTGDCDNALVQFLKTLNRILDKHTLREIGKVTVIEEEDLGVWKPSYDFSFLVLCFAASSN